MKSKEELSELHRFYQTLRTLNSNFNRCFAPGITVSIKFVLSTLLIVSNYNSIVLFGNNEVPLLVYMTLPSISLVVGYFLFYFFTMSGHIHELSAQLTDNLQLENILHTFQQARQTKQILKTFRPIGVNVGRMYTIKKHTCLHLFAIVVDQTISLVLASK